MKTSRVFSLLFRYGTLIFSGFSIAYLWKICHLDYYQSWGKFYAIWIPIVYAVFSTGYMLATEYCTRKISSPEARNRLDKHFVRFLCYDDYTYLFPLWIAGLEISASYLHNLYFWLSISYIGLVVIKTALFLTYLYEHIRQTAKQNHGRGRVPFHIQVSLVLTALAVYSLISAYHIQRTPLTGDEPHYLLITHSLMHDHDTNLYNNYNNRDYESFYWYELKPTWGDQVSETGIYSYRHKGGFPHTLIPGYFLGGQIGVRLQIHIITALIMLQVFLLSYELFQSLTASFATWICMAFTIPMIIYMGQIYPETLAALLTLWAVRRIRMFYLGDSLLDRRFWKNCLYIGIPLIILVLLKTRYLPLAGTLVLFLIFRLFQGRLHIKHKIRMVVGLGIVLTGAALAAFLVDTFFFDNMFRDRITDTEYMVWMLGGYNPLFGFLGLMFDQEYGLFPYTPLYMLAFVGIGLLTRKELRNTIPLLMIFGLNYLVICLWPLWHAAPTPPSRYILPVLPFLGVFLTKFFVQQSTFIKAIVLGLCSIWSFLSALIITINPWWRYNWADGSNSFLEMLSLRLSMHVTKIFPSWIRLSPLTPYLTILGIAGIGAVIYACRLEAKNSRKFFRNLTPEFTILTVLVLFMGLCFGGLLIGKRLPTSILEAEDALDVRAIGGEKVPPTSDPWDNQLYLREWKYYGWKLNPGTRLRARPKLSYSLPSSKFGKEVEWELQVYARSEESDKEKSKKAPVMLITLNGKEIDRVTVSSTNWETYNFTLFVDESRPLLEIIHQDTSDSQRALIIDKLRFR